MGRSLSAKARSLLAKVSKDPAQLTEALQRLQLSRADIEEKALEDFGQPDFPEDLLQLRYKHFQKKRLKVLTLVQAELKNSQSRPKILTPPKAFTSLKETRAIGEKHRNRRKAAYERAHTQLLNYQQDVLAKISEKQEKASLLVKTTREELVKKLQEQGEAHRLRSVPQRHPLTRSRMPVAKSVTPHVTPKASVTPSNS